MVATVVKKVFDINLQLTAEVACGKEEEPSRIDYTQPWNEKRRPRPEQFELTHRAYMQQPEAQSCRLESYTRKDVAYIVLG
jgi:hypothetical protein